MEYKQSLARRIVIAFMLMTVAVGGLFSAGIVGVVHIIEERLISRDLGGELERILRDDLAQGRNPVLDPGMRFFISDGQGSYAMPPALDQLDVGFHEVFEGDLSFHALVRDIDGRRFVLLQDQSDFEAREQVLYASVLTGYVLSIALAGLLGWMLARKVMEPVVRLARQVRHREQLLGLAPPLAPDYANDEVGELAASFDETLGRLRDALKREQLFTSDVSHELRTPLMVIATSCELLAEERNLLRNATHYTDAGSITLTLDEHGFSVEDTGAGVPEEQRERIFMPFVRGSSSSGRGEGLGLGLSLVKRICAAEGWSVTLSAVEPHGCRFEVLLDVA